MKSKLTKKLLFWIILTLFIAWWALPLFQPEITQQNKVITIDTKY